MARRKAGHKGDDAKLLPAILKFIQENPERATKRDIAKAFGLKGGDRVALKHLLAELTDAGELEKRGKRLALPGTLPPVAVLAITGRDPDGGLVAEPVNQEGMDECPRVRIALPRNRRTKLIIPGIGDRVLARISQDNDGYTGRVIKRLEKPKGATLGVIEQLKGGQFRVQPVERRGDVLDVDQSDLGDAKPGDLVEIDVIKSGRYGLARARVREVIGALGSEKAVSLIAIHAHGIPNRFPQNALDEADKANPPQLAPPREDWRALPLITIDPADAKDHDDAVFACPDDDPANAGGHIVSVAIADVAHFVRPGTPLDEEASKRGNSVYFPDRVVPMLPERISNDLCSLREAVERPALAVRMIFDAKGQKRSHSFHRIMMRSAAKLSYEQAQAAIEGAPDAATAPLLEPILRPLWKAYRCLLKGRDRRQPLELDLPEQKIRLDEAGKVAEVVVPPRLDTHKLIEEFMIQANVAAAEELEKLKQTLVFRVHDSPSLAKQEALRTFLKTLDIGLARGPQLKPSALNAILDRVTDTDHAELVNSVVLRSQSQAEYSPDNYGHFGLNLPRYAHFTSPIRRYADLIVHRALISALGWEDGDGLPKLAPDDLRGLAEHISRTERRAALAERETVDRLIAEHLSEKVGQSFVGRVAGMSSAGLFVSLQQFGADGFVPASTLGDEYFHHDEGLHAMVGERSAKGHRLGDAVEVKIEEVVPLAGSMRFEMLSEPRDLGISMTSRHKAGRARRAGRTNSRNPRPSRGRARRKRDSRR